MTIELKTYTCDRRMLLKPKTAAALGTKKRFYDVGELVELPDFIAKKLIERGTIHLTTDEDRQKIAEAQEIADFMNPKPAAKKTATKKRAPAKKASVKKDEVK